MEHEQCDACGFDGATFDNATLIQAIMSLGPAWRQLLAAAGTELRVRPGAEVWSAIEYAAHSRDITALHCFGVQQALTGSEPKYPDIMADEMIAEAAAGYGDLDAEAVVDALEDEACRLATMATGAEDRWHLGLTVGQHRSTVRRLLEHALHDSLHHVADVERNLRIIRHPAG